MALSRNQKRALNALLNHATVLDAAESVGLSAKTFYIYLKDEEFAAEMEARFEAETLALKAAFNAKVSVALDTLLEIMQDPDVKPYNRILAAKAWLNQRATIMEASQSTAELKIRGQMVDDAFEKYVGEIYGGASQDG